MALAGVLALTVPLAACGGDTTGTDGTDGNAGTDASSAPVSPSESAGGSDTGSPEPSSDDPSPEQLLSPVYYAVDTRTGFRLAAEQTDVGTGDPVAAAVTKMIAGADDPDYGTTWNPATEVLGVRSQGRQIVVDLSEDARTANAGSESAALMIQQLVYTATAANGTPGGSVELLIEGRPAGELWGVVTWTGAVRRADPLDVRVLVAIDTPTEGAAVTSPVTVSGEAAAFEATVPWRVLDQDGKVVKRGFTTAAEAFTFSPYSFTVRLKPGTYTVEVAEDDPSGGTAGPPMTDTRTIVVE